MHRDQGPEEVLPPDSSLAAVPELWDRQLRPRGVWARLDPQELSGLDRQADDAAPEPPRVLQDSGQPGAGGQVLEQAQLQDSL